MNNTIKFDRDIYINSAYTVGGKTESEGPIGALINITTGDDMFGEDTFEKAERKYFLTAAKGALREAGMEKGDADIMIAGDLLNQIVSAGYAARELQIPFLGVYGACSTMAEAMLIGGMAIDGGHAQSALCAVSSSFGAAERQYRFPLELGTPRTPTSQHTVTAGASCVISSSRRGAVGRITGGTIGRVVDLGITDANDMGAAMAGAALQTIADELEGRGVTADHFDVILTGDLGRHGTDMLLDMGRRVGTELGGIHADGGLEIYAGRGNVQCGGSGCACGATVLFSKYMRKLARGDIKRLLFVATGALLSPTVICQGESIPAVAHAVEIEGVTL